MLEQSTDCAKKITQAKNDYINKMTDKQNPSTAPKTYWAILSRLLYKKNCSNTTTIGWWQICFRCLRKSKSF